MLLPRQASRSLAALASHLAGRPGPGGGFGGLGGGGGLRALSSTLTPTPTAAGEEALAHHPHPHHPPQHLPPPGGPTILLMSGGVESAVLVHHYAHWSHADTVYPLFVDYAQAAAPRERLAGRAAAAAAGGLTLLEVDATALGEQLRALHAPARPHVPLPHRNLFLLAVAASYAPTIGATTIALALCKDDLEPLPGGGHRSDHPGGGGKADAPTGKAVSGGGADPTDAATTAPTTVGPSITTTVAYSTASKAFLDAARAMLATLSPPLALAAPLQCMSKAAVVGMGSRLPALSLSSTWSCAKAPASGRHCGVCVQCKARRAAFVAAGVEEEEGAYDK